VPAEQLGTLEKKRIGYRGKTCNGSVKGINATSFIYDRALFHIRAKMILGWSSETYSIAVYKLYPSRMYQLSSTMRL